MLEDGIQPIARVEYADENGKLKDVMESYQGLHLQTS
jgi:hypothetical protein